MLLGCPRREIMSYLVRNMLLGCPRREIMSYLVRNSDC
jgi:hypothetical protein